MSRTRITSALLAMVGWTMLTAVAAAQHQLRHVPPHISNVGTDPDVVQPFVDWGTFETDAQFFAPTDLGDFGDPPAAKTGWFGQYDRVYVWVTRPEANFTGTNAPGPGFLGTLAHTEGDFTWGHRLDLGYMTEENHGWLFTGWHINGPNEDRGFVWTRDVATNQWIWLRAERIDRVNTDTGEILPVQDRNNFYTGARDFIMHESLNIADLSGFEMNKLFRLKPLHHNSVLEPFFGFRYVKFIDMFRRMQYERFDANGNPVPLLPPPGGTLQPAVFEELGQDFSSFTNHMVGGHLGVRWFKNKGHWNLSSQFRMFAGQNFQAYSFQRDQIVTQYTGTTIVDERAERFNTDTNRAEFVLMGDVRAEAAYYLTRDFALQFGAEVMHFGFGVARGNNPNQNSEDLTLVGATFGFTYNR